MMSKKALREWPWNNAPSKRHVWREIRTSTYTGGGHTAKCERCDRTFIERTDTRGPVYCCPTPAWLAAHPDDDKKEG